MSNLNSVVKYLLLKNMRDPALLNSSHSLVTQKFGCRRNCHKHALFVQPAQTHLSFDIWLMLSRGTAAGTGYGEEGRLELYEFFSDSSSCCVSITPCGIFFLFFVFLSCSPKHFVHNKCKLPFENTNLSKLS
ncbi:hypothetical protein ATANTOWER_016012 [Ataeniobius toweri]|uniref:Uncharacterized protein n=1 Tax=Ataeniobius toweri TaxID=208326 RepID=A0ABU7B4F4_9TELE|nr:hypothetical protein [Ataeniobius toweri]